MQSNYSIIASSVKGEILKADAPIVAGETICRARAIPIDSRLRSTMIGTELGDVSFVERAGYDPQRDAAFGGYVVLGDASLCSHSDAPNADVEFRPGLVGVVCVLRAIRPIAAGEEITIAYRDIEAGRYYDRDQWEA